LLSHRCELEREFEPNKQTEMIRSMGVVTLFNNDFNGRRMVSKIGILLTVCGVMERIDDMLFWNDLIGDSTRWNPVHERMEQRAGKY
jgi:hypothetical protein